MIRSLSTRQSIRRAMILISFLLFPVILNYLSPYLIIAGASEGVINGSFISFVLLFFSAWVLGRAWCGWLCPGAGLQEACMMARNTKVNPKKIGWIKWLIWVPWLVGILLAVVSAGGYRRIDPFYMTENIVSVTEPFQYITYYLVISLFVVQSFSVGNRAFCYTTCWMAPFMIVGRKLRNLLNTPALRLQVEPEKCSDCKSCTRNCPMSLDVNLMVASGEMEHSECILCGNCVDSCKNSVIRYTFSANSKLASKKTR